MKNVVFVIGKFDTELDRLKLRKQQAKIMAAGAETISVLDFAEEGHDYPTFHQIKAIQYYFISRARHVVVGDMDDNAVNKRVLEMAELFKVPVIPFRDIVFTGTNPFKVSFWDKVDAILKPWFTNPMKA
jgi:hypothetical protein